MDRDEDLVVFGHRSLDILDPQDFWRPVPVVHNCSHEPSSAKRFSASKVRPLSTRNWRTTSGWTNLSANGMPMVTTRRTWTEVGVGVRVRLTVMSMTPRRRGLIVIGA